MMRQPRDSWGSGWHKAKVQNETHKLRCRMKHKAKVPYKNTKLRYSKNTK